MTESGLASLVVVTVTIAAVALCVLVHYEGLLLTLRGLRRVGGAQRVKVLYGMFSMLVLHIIEVCIFGLVIWLLLQWPACGKIVSATSSETAALGLLDAFYLSAVTYTTVGFGDVVPVGSIRFVCGLESLAGFLLIGWSASFTYLEMERFWRGR